MPKPTDVDADLIAWEAELEAALSEFGRLTEACRTSRSAVERARAGREREDLLDRIGELQVLIARTPAQSLAGAAVQLRRLAAMLESERATPALRLVESVRQAVERVP